MKSIRRSKKSGFTIVELVVVVVVIAILATITLVGYGSIQKNAYNTQVIAGVVQYRETIEAYKAYFKKYPQTTREIAGEQVSMVCLGSGYTDQYCGKISDVNTYEDAAFNQELSKIGTGGSISSTKLVIGAEGFVGAAYGIDRTTYERSPTLWSRTIQYALKGSSSDCGIEDAWSYAIQTTPAGTACEINLEQVPAP